MYYYILKKLFWRFYIHCACICTLTLSQQNGSVLEYVKGVVVLHRYRKYATMQILP